MSHAKISDVIRSCVALQSICRCCVYTFRLQGQKINLRNELSPNISRYRVRRM